MFKPHYSTCICHGKHRLIVVKKGYCKTGNDERKGRNSKEKPINRSNIGRTGNRPTHSKIRLHNESKNPILDAEKVKKTSKDRSQLQYNRKYPGKKKNIKKSVQKTIEKGKNVCLKKRLFCSKMVRSSRGTSTYKRKKPTGELEVFKRIYEARGPNSQIAPFRWIAFDVRCFSHILTKGAYPAFRLYEKNIVLKTPQEHHLWETARHKLKNLPEWEFIFELEQELKREYYDNTRL